LQHFRMFEGDGNEHTGCAGRFAFVLFPTSKGAESDSKKIGEGFLREVKGLANFGNLTFGIPCLGGLAALGFWIYGDTGKCAVGFLLDAKHPGGRALAPLQRVFLGFESDRLGGRSDGFNGFLRLSSFNWVWLRFSDSFLA